MEPLKKVQVEGYLMFAEPQDLFGNLDELCYVSWLNRVDNHKPGLGFCIKRCDFAIWKPEISSDNHRVAMAKILFCFQESCALSFNVGLPFAGKLHVLSRLHIVAVAEFRTDVIRAHGCRHTGT